MRECVLVGMHTASMYARSAAQTRVSGQEGVMRVSSLGGSTNAVSADSASQRRISLRIISCSATCRVRVYVREKALLASGRGCCGDTAVVNMQAMLVRVQLRTMCASYLGSLLLLPVLSSQKDKL